MVGNNVIINKKVFQLLSCAKWQDQLNLISRSNSANSRSVTDGSLKRNQSASPLSMWQKKVSNFLLSKFLQFFVKINDFLIGLVCCLLADCCVSGLPFMT